MGEGMSKKERSLVIILSILLFGGMLLLNGYLNYRNKKDILEYKKMESATMDGTLYNLWIVNGEEKEIIALVNDTLCTFQLKNRLNKNISGTIADLKLEKGIVKKIILKEDTIQGKVLSISDTSIEIDGYGELPIGKGYKVYQTYIEEKKKGAGADTGEEKNIVDASPNDVKKIDKKKVLVGYDNTAFVVADGKICAGLVQEPIEIGNIRVLIKTTGYKSEYHSQVTLTATTEFTIEYGNQQKKYKKGEKASLNMEDHMFSHDGYIKVIPKKNGKITLLSVERACGNPSYRGDIEIARKKGKGLVIVNEVDLEQYLYGVIGSEMPVSYGEEPLKVQAVCARSYAYRQLLSNDCGEYGAHVDDSISYQVYNNSEECRETRNAVDKTKGLIMQYNGDVAIAYYFSTSCGQTASAQDVWQSGKEEKYLQGHTQNEDKKDMDLSKEEKFKEFIKNKNFESFDKEFPWYRWSVTISSQQLENSIDSCLYDRYTKNPNQILTKQKDGSFASKSIHTIGTVKEIKVLERGKSGVIKSLQIKGSNATIKVAGEYNIRVLLAPINNTIYRGDDSQVQGMNMLPSGFFNVSNSKDKKDFVFQGGGYGHGVGMSQNGTKAMAEKGYRYEEILCHYYRGVTVGRY